MKINGVELSLDVSNPEELTAASRFIDDTRAAIAKIGKRGFLENTVHLHRSVSNGLDRMYGPGVGTRVCGEKASGLKAVTAVCEFMEEYWRQIDHMGEVFERTKACWDRFDRQAEMMEKKAASGKQGAGDGSSEAPVKEPDGVPFVILPQGPSEREGNV